MSGDDDMNEFSREWLATRPLGRGVAADCLLHAL
jgi:hypothetical protein